MNEIGPVSHEPLVLSVRLPPGRLPIFAAWPVGLLGLCVVLAGTSMLQGGPGIGGLVLMVVFTAAVLVGGVVVLHGLDKLRQRVSGEDEPLPHSSDTRGAQDDTESQWDVLVGRLSHRGSLRSIFTGGLWNWPKMVRAAGDRGLEIPRALVDRRLWPAIRDIEIIDDLVEREFIAVSVTISGPFIVALLALALFLAVRAAVKGDWLDAAGFMVIAAIFAPAVPWVKKHVPMVRAEAEAPIAAPGEVKDRRGRRWCADNAVMVVQAGPPIWRRGGEGLHVCLIGEAGRLELAFQSPDDPDFITLWQRWVHPHPRPELAVEDPSEAGGG